MQIAPDIYFYPFSSYTENNANTIIIDGPEKLIIDPGHKHLWPELKKKIEEDGINPAELKLVLHTHCHPDHMEAGQILESDYGAIQAMSGEELEYLTNGPGKDFFPWMGLDYPTGAITRVLEEGTLNLGDKVLNLYLTPGHSPGSLCVHWPEGGVLVTGDLIFARGVGRTDFPYGDHGQLVDSVRRMEKLEGVEFILPGHGPAILGAKQIAANYSAIESYL